MIFIEIDYNKIKFNDYLENLFKYINNIHQYYGLYNSITNATKIIKLQIVNKKNIFIIGNGGSMATAIHFAEDLMCCNDHKVKVISLNNVSKITAISNDYDYEDVFAKQLENLMDEGDLVIGITCSGNSQNIIKAFEYAKNNGGITLGITGFNGGKVKDIANYNIHIKTKVGDYGATEDVHYIICHIISELIKNYE